jgi:hypothetical protein
MLRVRCPLCEKVMLSGSNAAWDHLIETEGIKPHTLKGWGTVDPRLVTRKGWREFVLAAAMRSSFEKGDTVCAQPDGHPDFPPGCGRSFNAREGERPYYCCNGCGQRRAHTEDCRL